MTIVNDRPLGGPESSLIRSPSMEIDKFTDGKAELPSPLDRSPDRLRLKDFQVVRGISGLWSQVMEAKSIDWLRTSFWLTLTEVKMWGGALVQAMNEARGRPSSADQEGIKRLLFRPGQTKPSFDWLRCG